jgi:hypothetical protein
MAHEARIRTCVRPICAYEGESEGVVAVDAAIAPAPGPAPGFEQR